jgi:2-phosphoglycerate kinase
MVNPNNNENAYQQALKINRDLKKKMDELIHEIELLHEIIEVLRELKEDRESEEDK